MIDLTYNTTIGGSLSLALPTYILWDQHDGFGHPNVQMYTESTAYQDGSSFLGLNFQDRKLDFNFTVRGSSANDLTTKKELVQKIFNSHNGQGLLTIVRDSTTYYCDVYSLGIKPLGGEGHGSWWQSYQLAFTGLDCTFYRTLHTYNLTESTGGFSFPFSFPFSLGTVGWSQTATNAGDAESPLIITIVGEVTHPKISNITTGKWMELYSVAANETVVIDCGLGTITSTIGSYSANAMHYMTNDSDFLFAQSGANALTYTATSDITATTVTVTFYDRYSGI